LEEEPWDVLYAALHADLMRAPSGGFDNPLLNDAQSAAARFEPVSLREQFGAIDEDWLDPEVWRTIRTYAGRYTPGYFLNSVDLKLTADGVQYRDEGDRIYILLFGRTLYMSLVITISCILLGYPVAFLHANLPLRTANMLM
ncbi:MAG: ABC transporter permease, partial [Boseongicola sp.]|nr:ABC transporter permease [Boseongicola sp.]